MEGRLYYSKFTGIFFASQLVVGVGINTLPYAANKAGFIISFIVCGWVCFVSYIASTYIIESLAAANAKRYLTPLMPPRWDQGEMTRSDRFKFHDRVEFQGLLKSFLSEWQSTIIYVLFVFYLYCVICIHGVELALTVSYGIQVLFGGSPTAFDDQMGWYNGTYNIILIVMYALLFFPSLKNVAYLQWLSNIVVALKLFILICFFIGSFTGLGMEQSSAGDSLGKFDIDGLAYIFGNVNFAFLMHHTIPGIVYPLKQEYSSQSVLLISFITGFVIYFFHMLFALAAFGGVTNQDCANFPCAIQPLFSLNMMGLTFIQWAVSFYTIGNILPITVKTIVLRNNIMGLFFPTKVQGDQSKIDGWTIIFTLVVMLPILLIGIFIPDIQKLVRYTGGYLGIVVLVIIPISLIVGSRFWQKDQYGNVMEKQINKHQSPFRSFAWIFVLLAHGLISLTVVTYNTFSV